jgi:tetratricopeptide (TPR) repeat protein
MPKSKHTRKDKRRNKSGPPPKKRTLEGLQFRTFEISDAIDQNYQPGIADEMVEAILMLREGRAEEAKAAFERIIEREPRVREAYLNLAVAHAYLGDEATAETLTLQTLDKFPDYAMARINLARTYLHRRQLKEAKEMLLPLDDVRRFTAEGDAVAAQSWKRMLYDVVSKNPALFR